MGTWDSIFAVLGINNTLKIQNVEAGMSHTLIEPEFREMMQFVRGNDSPPVPPSAPGLACSLTLDTVCGQGSGKVMCLRCAGRNQVLLHAAGCSTGNIDAWCNSSDPVQRR